MSANCDELYISCLFPPSDYVSGINVLKRIIESNVEVDVLHINLKSSDNSVLNKNIEKFINNHLIIDIDCNYDWADCIFEVIKRGLSALKNDYAKIYSRSWLMSNHFLALEYKFLHKDVFWQAEFSDPLIYDLSNKPKRYKQMIIEDDEYIAKINNQIDNYNSEHGTDFDLVKNNTSAYFICEYLTYLFADKLIFTNENQREIMLNQFPIDIKEHIFNKTEIKAHSILPYEYYHLNEIDLDLNDEYLNIAYFGNDYYGKRHFESIFYAFETLNHKYLDKVKFHIFTSDEDIIKNLINTLDSFENFIVKKPLSYLEFLNACTQFDVLVVTDVITEGIFELNPYLPSKLSDYLGSNTDIWALYENDSTLSKYDLKYNSDISDFKACRSQLVKILNDHDFVDEDFTIDEESYLIKRLTVLNELYEMEFRRKVNFRNKADNLEKLNNEILSSNSWKLTEPLRKIRK